MADILPRHYIFGIIFFSFIILSGITLINITNHDKVADNPEYDYFVTNFDKYQAINGTLGNYTNSVKQNDTSLFGDLGVIGTLASTTWTTLSFMIDTLDFMDTVWAGGELWGIPSYVGQIFIMIVIVVVIFALWSAIFQTKI